MTAPALSFPATRDLAALWAHLRSWQPHALWIGALHVHRVEALVHATERVPADALARAALRYLTGHTLTDAEPLRQQFGIGSPMARVLLENLRRQGWIVFADAQWRLTPAGAEARDQGTTERHRHARRVFHFAVPSDAEEAHFLPLPSGLAAPCAPPSPAWSFAPAWLDSCIAAPDEWKQRYHFPKDIKHLCRLGETRPGCEGIPEWRRVILDRAERLTLAITAGERCLGFALNANTWRLQRPEPVFSFSSDEASAVVGRALAIPEDADWRGGWETVRRPLGLPPGQISNFRPTPQGPRLTIVLSAAAADRARSIADLWLLAGSGSFRCAAVPEFQAAP